MYYRRFDDRITLVPIWDDESRLITNDEFSYLQGRYLELQGNDRESIEKECWEELRKYRAIHGTPPIEERPLLGPAPDED
jgi:hypothetical protein